MSLKPRVTSQLTSPLDADTAYVLGLLHDIGRRAGVTGLRHSLDGYLFLSAEGCEDAGRVCLTHCFQCRDVRESFGAPDCTPEEMTFIDDYLAQVEYNDYDRLIAFAMRWRTRRASV